MLPCLVACSMPKDYIRSANAPSFGVPQSPEVINAFLDSAGVPEVLRFDPLLDSLPNRTFFRPTAFLFKGQDTFINLTVCNAHYKDIKRSIEHYDRPHQWVTSYPLRNELSALQDVRLEDLPKADYYLVFYWRLSDDNLNWRNIKSLQKSLAEEDLSLVVLYVNVDNRPAYGLNEEEYLAFIQAGRTISTEHSLKWFEHL